MTDRSPLGSWALIVLTWKNVEDTLACIRSIFASGPVPAAIWLVDNGSGSEITHPLIDGLAGLDPVIHRPVIRNGRYQGLEPGPVTGFHLFLHQENEGFAGGNNPAIRLGLDHGFEQIQILNNDTVVPAGFFGQLQGTVMKHPQIPVWTPVILYHDRPDLIWNAGGFLTWWGDRRYLGAKKPRTDFPAEGYQPVTFITGCCLLATGKVWALNDGLSDRFFFGEEDYHFSMMLKANQIIAAVDWSSSLQHKVSVSVKRETGRIGLGMMAIHHLNRLVNMAQWKSGFSYRIWKGFYLGYAAFLVWWKRWFPLPVMIRFLRFLLKESANRQSVTRDDFLRIRSLTFLKD
ncbi:MAG: glycosyltransferase family 2 protein [Bacteroidetes bacterium]|nr:glycosyltransferase family 2 protein [Bacteroidota bacterium]